MTTTLCLFALSSVMPHEAMALFEGPPTPRAPMALAAAVILGLGCVLYTSLGPPTVMHLSARVHLRPTAAARAPALAAARHRAPGLSPRALATQPPSSAASQQGFSRPPAPRPLPPAPAARGPLALVSLAVAAALGLWAWHWRRLRAPQTTWAMMASVAEAPGASSGTGRFSPQLRGIPVFSAETQQQTDAGDVVPTEGRAVVCLMPHFADLDPWEQAEWLVDELPRLEAAGTPLICIGIGTAEAAAEFCARTRLPPRVMYADPEARCHKALALDPGVGREGGTWGEIPVSGYLKLLVMGLGIGIVS